MRPLEFGWYLPTHGDTTAYGLMETQIPSSHELCDRVVAAAEQAGFEYLLIPVGSVCWEAWITGAFMAARSSSIKPLIAARPGYINPVLLAKMISTFDQMSGGRICINLIAGQNESEVEGEGVRYPKEERYALMEEEVSIIKALWTTRGPVNFQGKFHTLAGAHIRPRPLQQPFPKFYLGGGSRQAWELSARHSDVHLFWGRSAGEDRIKHRRDQADGAGAWPRKQHRLRHAAASDLPRKRGGRLGGRRSAGAPRHRAAEAGNEDTLQQIRSEFARAATRPRAWRSAAAASVDGNHESPSGRRDCGGRQSRPMR